MGSFYLYYFHDENGPSSVPDVLHIGGIPPTKYLVFSGTTILPDSNQRRVTMTAYTHTIFPGYVPDGFFDEDNVQFIRAKIAEVLKREYVQSINVDIGSVKRIMQRVIGERLEPIPKMNQRVIMYITNEYRNHQADLHKKLKWEEHYIESQRLYDPTVERTFDKQIVKLANRLGKARVGGTVRFVFM